MANEFFKLEGVPEFNAAITRILVAADLAAKTAVGQAAHMIEAAAKKEFEGSHKKGEPHVGGSRPNVVTGNLRRSIVVTGPTRIGVGTYAAEVGPTAIYGRAVELGLWQNPAVKYPYFTPGFNAALPGIKALWKGLAEQALKKGTSSHE